MKKAAQNSTMELENWLTEIAATIAHALQLLKETDRVTTKRADLGVTVTVYFNWASVVKIDISRMDKKGFFSEPFSQY